MKNLYLIIICLIPSFLNAQNFNTIEKAFEVPEHDLIPEGIAYDKKSDAFFVGSIFKSKIVKIDTEGKVSDFVASGNDGPWGYLGLKVRNETNTLWACRNPMSNKADSAGYSGLFIYDIPSGALIKRYTTKDKGHLFNDLVFVETDAYITDSQAGAVYKIDGKTDSLTVFIAPGSFIYPNGITLSPDGKSLFISTASGLQKINLASKEITPLNHPGYYILGVDGLYTYKGALIGIQNIIKPESINQFALNEANDEISKVNTLISAHPAFYLATTGTIKDGWLYFIANSYVTLLNAEGIITNEEPLKNLEVYRLRLD